VIELLTPIDILDGRHISGSGTITIDGKVGPIGGINEKIQAAYKAGATLFLAPIGNRDEITNVPKGVKVVIVATLDDAMKAITAKG
jgi:PDZ domain-containing protein